MLQASPTAGFWGHTAVKEQLGVDRPHTQSYMIPHDGLLVY